MDPKSTVSIAWCDLIIEILHMITTDSVMTTIARALGSCDHTNSLFCSWASKSYENGACFSLADSNLFIVCIHCSGMVQCLASHFMHR